MNKKIKIKKLFDSKMEDLISVREYEEHKLDIESFIETGSNDERNDFFLIKLNNYLIPLINIGKYEKALKINLELQKVVRIVLGKSKYYKQFVEILSFNKAKCLHYLGQYNKSSDILKELLTSSPDNNLYTKWYRANAHNQIDEFFIPILYFCGGVYVILLIIDYSNIYNNTFFLQNLFFFGGILSFAISYLLKKRINKNYSKK